MNYSYYGLWGFCPDWDHHRPMAEESDATAERL